MCHDNSSTVDFAAKIGNATHALSFNEPDRPEQANMSPVEAAKAHIKLFNDLKGKIQVGSPAVTNGVGTSSSPMGSDWLKQFLVACSSPCPVDFIAYHWYDPNNDIDHLKNYTDTIVQIAAGYNINKVWLTEFAPTGNNSTSASFMTDAVAYLDSNPAVERYAAFMASDGFLLSGTTLNLVGEAYVE